MKNYWHFYDSLRRLIIYLTRWETSKKLLSFFMFSLCQEFSRYLSRDEDILPARSNDRICRQFASFNWVLRDLLLSLYFSYHWNFKFVLKLSFKVITILLLFYLSFSFVLKYFRYFFHINLFILIFNHSLLMFAPHFIQKLSATNLQGLTSVFITCSHASSQFQSLTVQGRISFDIHWGKLPFTIEIRRTPF